MAEHTETLHIRNFGPITEAEIVFSKYTILIGEQGSGKSTIAKLYALFTWLEKAITRHQVTKKYVTQYSRFINTYCSYNNIDSYFKKHTYLCFIGLHYKFLYENDVLQINDNDETPEDFNTAKVMYVPAERSILGSIDHPTRLKGLTEPMRTFLEEYDIARENIKTGYKLPFDEVNFEYDKLNDVSWIKNAEYKIKLSSASSGYQSTLPLLLVSSNLSDMVFDKSKKSDLDDKERKALQKEVDKIMTNTSLSEEVRNASLRSISSRFKYSRFINIVEEMELNLYPVSQKSVLYELFADNNKLADNRLLLTTHSPYIINFITLSVKAEQLSTRCAGRKDIQARIYDIVPQESLVESSTIHIYELLNGRISLLENYQGIPSDDNFLNNSLEETNSCYDSLLEIEEDMSNN